MSELAHDLPVSAAVEQAVELAQRGVITHLTIHSGDHRLIYAVDDHARVVTVAAIGHRRDVYQRLSL
jgi:mRNA-degrading endonuclease RelE of RelBE toxin-antitoxin system